MAIRAIPEQTPSKARVQKLGTSVVSAFLSEGGWGMAWPGSLVLRVCVPLEGPDGGSCPPNIMFGTQNTRFACRAEVFTAPKSAAWHAEEINDR